MAGHALPRWAGMTAFSLLDLAPVPEGATVGDALRNTLDLARQAEAWGYRRFWLAEHHNMPGIASAATAVLIGQVAAATRTIRVGAGGIMLPNHAPLMVAEAFGTLATLFPDRIDLGLGRAPGTDMATARALRRHMEGADSFPHDVVELMGYLGDDADGRPRPRHPRHRHPRPGLDPRLVALRRPARRPPRAALRLRLALRARRPRARDRGLPHHLPPLGGAGGALPDARLQRLRRRHRRRGRGASAPRCSRPSSTSAPARPARCPVPSTTSRRSTTPPPLALVDQALSCSAAGSPETVRRGLADFIARHRPGRADPDRADPRPRGAAPLVRDRRRGHVRARPGARRVVVTVMAVSRVATAAVRPIVPARPPRPRRPAKSSRP